MRIGYITTEDLSKSDGGRVHFRAIASELSRMGNRVCVIAPKYGPKHWVEFDSNDIEKLKIRVAGKNAFGLACFELIMFSGLPWFKLKYRWYAILVRGGGPSVFMWLVFLLGRFLGMRVVLECNGVTWAEFRSRGYSALFCAYAKWSAWSQAKTASAIVGVTPAICDAYCKLAQRPANDGFPISNGVSTEKFPLADKREIRQELHWDASRTVFIMPSSFAPWHGLRELLEAIKMLPEEIREKSLFVLPGDGEMRKSIEGVLFSSQLQNCVLMPGRLDRTQIYRTLVAADAGLFLCTDQEKIRFPGSPLKLFEYFGAGLPVIVSSDSYHSKLIPYYGLGMVLDSVTPQHLACAIKEFIDGTIRYDRGRIRETAEKEFHWARVAQRVLAVLNNTEPELERWLIDCAVVP